MTVAVWRAGLDVAPAVLPLLSPDERTRADRFRRGADAARSIVARGVLRVVLGDRLGLPPDELRFAEGRHGKPVLAWPTRPEPAFNVSHDGDVVLVAVRDRGSVGVDVETIRRGMDWPAIAERWFTAGERCWLQGRGADALWTTWVRKEAWLKATGDGLTADLDAVDTSDDELPGGWVLSLDLGPAHAAAVAGDGEPPLHVSVQRWPAAR